MQIDDVGRFDYLLRKFNKRELKMIEDDEKDLLRQKIEDSKSEQYKQNAQIFKLNSLLNMYLQERLESEENEAKLFKLFEAGIIYADGNPVEQKD